MCSQQMTTGRTAAYLAAIWAYLLVAGMLVGGQGGGCPTGNFTAEDCPNNSCFAAPPNGCGSRSLDIISADIVPDEWPAGVDFSEACNTHDRCYFTPGAVKEECDNAFHQALLAECDRAVRCVDIPIIGEECGDNPLLSACQGLADVYYEAVSSVAQEPFEDDQREAAAHAERCAENAATAG